MNKMQGIEIRPRSCVFSYLSLGRTTFQKIFEASAILANVKFFIAPATERIFKMDGRETNENGKYKNEVLISFNKNRKKTTICAHAPAY